MCFYNDYDWYADVAEVTDGPSDEAAKCYECRCTIQPGGFRRHVYLLEHEECQVCEWEEADEPCREHDYGEVFTCNICEVCVKLLEAIKAVEMEAGCLPDETQPAYGELNDALWYDEDRTYLKRALEMFPEIASTDRLQGVNHGVD